MAQMYELGRIDGNFRAEAERCSRDGEWARRDLFLSFAARVHEVAAILGDARGEADEVLALAELEALASDAALHLSNVDLTRVYRVLTLAERVA
jgi:hypothetical protein